MSDTTNDDDDAVFRVYPEVEADLKRLKAKPPQNTAGVVAAITGTILPYVMELADHQREHEMMHRDVFDRLEALEEATGIADEEPDTRIQAPLAADLELLVTYAREMAKKMLNAPEDAGGPAPGSTAYLELQAIVDKAEATLVAVAEATMDEEEDDEAEAEEAVVE